MAEAEAEVAVAEPEKSHGYLCWYTTKWPQACQVVQLVCSRSNPACCGSGNCMENPL